MKSKRSCCSHKMGPVVKFISLPYNYDYRLFSTFCWICKCHHPWVFGTFVLSLLSSASALVQSVWDFEVIEIIYLPEWVAGLAKWSTWDDIYHIRSLLGLINPCSAVSKSGPVHGKQQGRANNPSALWTWRQRGKTPGKINPLKGWVCLKSW